MIININIITSIKKTLKYHKSLVFNLLLGKRQANKDSEIR